MSLNVSNRTARQLRNLSIEPIIAVAIDGVPFLFSTDDVKDVIRIGDPGLNIDDINGEDWFIGGLKKIDNNLAYLDRDSTTFTIRQQMNYDENKSSSVSTMTITFVDKDQKITELISPGFLIDDILGRKVEVYVGFGDSSFFEDYLLVFRGFVVSVESGPGPQVKLKINHPDTKKLGEIFKKAETTLTNSVGIEDTTLTVEDTNLFLPAIPDFGGVDIGFRSMVRIQDEFIEYTGISGNDLTGCVRRQRGSTFASHDAGEQVSSIYEFTGNPLDIALAIMSSGFGGDSITDVEITSFRRVGDGTTQVPNAIYFQGINIPRRFSLTPGDKMSVTGATNILNNFTNRTITAITELDGGYYIEVDGDPFVLEQNTTALASFRSRYDVLPDGLKMDPSAVDVVQHERVRNLFHSDKFFDFLIDDNIKGREFIDEQCYRPIACYSIPRKSAASVTYTVGPVPGTNITTLDINNVKNANGSLRVKRTTQQAFANEVIYKFDPTAQDPDKFAAGVVLLSAESKNRIDVENKAFTIEARGVRASQSGFSYAQIEAQRVIDRYKFGAEIFTAEALLRDTIQLELGDIVLFDGKDLQVSDTTKGNRQFEPRLLEVKNRNINLKTGRVQFELLNTGFSVQSRYGLMCPSSLIDKVLDASRFVIKPYPFATPKFGEDEFRSWTPLLGPNETIGVRVRSEDYTVFEDLEVRQITENTFTLLNPATITILPNYIIEFAPYNFSGVSEKQKLVYGWMTDEAAFDDGEPPYNML